MLKITTVETSDGRPSETAPGVTSPFVGKVLSKDGTARL